MSIKWKMLALYMLLACVPLLAVGLFYEQQKAMVRDNAMERLNAVASNLSERMSLIHRLNSERLAGVASRTQLRIIYERYLQLPTKQDEAKLKRIMGDALLSIPSFQRIVLSSPNGLHTVSTDDVVPPIYNQLIAEASSNDTDTATAVKKVAGHWQLIMVGPVKMDGETFGYVVMSIDASDVLDIARKDAYFKNSGDVYLVTHDGHQVVFLQADNASLSVNSPVVKAAVSGREENFSGILDVHQTPVLAASRFSKEFYLGLVLKVNEEEVFGALASLQRKQIIFSVLFILPVLILAYFIARSVFVSVARLRSLAEKVGAGDWSVRAKSTAKDEIGDLSRAFDNMLGELEHLNEKQASANQDLTHFTQIAAHDLREPARKGVALAELLCQSIQEKKYDDAERMTQYISSASERMLSMVDDFRVLTNIGDDESVREPVDLKSLIKEALRCVGEEVQNREVNIVFEMPQRTVMAYPSLLQLLYENLIKNAFEHVKSRSFCLTFTSEVTADGHAFGVHNTESSIPEYARRDVFKMFRSGKSSESSGIGLSICKKVVDRHKGAIWIESDEGFTHFKFILS